MAKQGRVKGWEGFGRDQCGQPRASEITEGDVDGIDLELDTEPRVVSEPSDLAEALNADPEARAAFDRSAYGLKRKHVRAIEEAKTPATRQRRITKLVTTLRLGDSPRRR